MVGVQAPSSAHYVLCWGWAQGLSCPGSGFIVLSCTENQRLVCSACHQGPGFLPAPRMFWWVNQFVSAPATPAR